MKKIPIKDQSGIRRVETNRIARFEADGNYTKICFTDQSSTLSTVTLKRYHEILHKKGFYRIHHKHLVNTEFIEYYRPHNNTVELTCKTTLPASFRKKSEFLLFMGEIPKL